MCAACVSTFKLNSESCAQLTLLTPYGYLVPVGGILLRKEVVCIDNIKTNLNEVQVTLTVPEIDQELVPVTGTKENQEVDWKDAVIEINGIPVTTSLKIAEVFGKPHNDVMKRIRIAEESYQKGGQGNFSQSSGVPFVQGTYKNQQNKDQPMFYLTEAGFSFVVMGFTGDKAAEWKWKYIAAFEAMKEELSKRNQPKPMTLLEVVAANAQALVDHEKKIIALQDDTEQIKSSIASLRNEIRSPFTDWNQQTLEQGEKIDDHEQ